MLPGLEVVSTNVSCYWLMWRLLAICFRWNECEEETARVYSRLACTCTKRQLSTLQVFVTDHHALEIYQAGRLSFSPTRQVHCTARKRGVHNSFQLAHVLDTAWKWTKFHMQKRCTRGLWNLVHFQAVSKNSVQLLCTPLFLALLPVEHVFTLWCPQRI